MRIPIRFLTRLLNVITSRRRSERPSHEHDQRLREEIDFHLAIQTEENLRSGMSPEQAHRQARVQFGSVEVVRETCHAERSLPLLDNLLLDLRYALRVLRKSPAFTIIACTTLMLGVGANIVVFGVLNAVLLHPLAISDPHSLYQLRHKQWMIGRLLTTSYPAFEDFRRRNTTFTGMAAINAYSHVVLNSRNTAMSLSGHEVTGNYFDLLGIQPQAGRFFHASDEHGPNSAPYLVISDALWRTRFHGDPQVIGTTVEINQHPFTIVAVAPAAFHGTEKFQWPDYWIPMVNEQQVDSFDYLHSRDSITVTVIGRLAPGVTPQQATDNLNTIAIELAKENPETDDGQPLRLIHPGLIGDEGDVIRGFLVSVAFLALLVLAAACANLATLFAARAADRGRELALRVALGSSRRRLVQQLLTEALLISLAGGAAALATAYAVLGLLNHSAPFAGTLTVTVDARVCLVGLALSIASALFFGLIPTRQVWPGSPLHSLHSGSADASRLRRFTMRDLLLAIQIAICTLLVTASLVAVRGMTRVLHLPLGFQPQGAMLIHMNLGHGDESTDLALQRVKATLDAARTISTVTAAGTISRTPMTGGMHPVPVFRPGTTEFKLSNSALAPYAFTMSPGYLDAAGTRLLEGRDFSWHDTADTPFVAIVNQTFARQLWPGAPAIGQRFILQAKLTEVVGVAEDGKYHDMQEPPQPVVYVPLLQIEDTDGVLVVRSPRPPGEMAAALQRALSPIEPNVAITAQSWPDALAGELFPARAATVALGVMGLLAAMLAVTGIFGMAAYNVSRRMKELSIRVALGARSAHIMSAAVGRPLVLLGAGSALGLLSGMLASRLLHRIVYQANPRDPLVVCGALLTMALLGLAASAIPARRALAVDPSKLMRED